jgi:hypothetical protein
MAIRCVFPKAEMIATLHDQPEFSELFMADLLSRNSRIEEDLIDQLFNSSEKRLARVLLLHFGKEATVEPIIGNFSQETLAEMIGTTRSRVSFFMNKTARPAAQRSVDALNLSIDRASKAEEVDHLGDEFRVEPGVLLRRRVTLGLDLPEVLLPVPTGRLVSLRESVDACG